MKYQNILKDNKVQCAICPRECKLRAGQEGFCHVRKNVDGEICLTTYGYNTGLAIDPIEKKPLYHFYPGTSVLSFGTFGCNMGCLFCQNYQTTKSKADTKYLNKAMPQEIVKVAIESGCKSVAFTYNDPVIFFEYAIDCAKLCRKKGVKTVAVTSGFINKDPRKEFFEYMDAANIDLKGFSEEFYKKNCLARLQPVLDTIKYVKNETSCHLELTTMIIEGENNSDDEIKRECDWIVENLGFNVPLHFSAFFPNYKFLNKKPTSLRALLRAWEIATSAGLNYVYLGNVINAATSATYCKNCKNLIIERDRYSVSRLLLNKDKCPYCGTICDGVF